MLAIFPLFIRSDINVCIDQTEKYNSCPRKNYQIVNNTDDLYQLLDNKNDSIHLVTFLTGKKILKLPITKKFTNHLTIDGNGAKIIIQNPKLISDVEFELQNITLDIEFGTYKQMPKFKSLKALNVIFTKKLSEIGVTNSLTIDITSLSYIQNITTATISLQDINSTLDDKISSSRTDITLTHSVESEIEFHKNSFNMYFTENSVIFKNEIINYTITLNSAIRPHLLVHLTNETIDSSLNFNYQKVFRFIVQIEVLNQAKLRLFSTTDANATQALQVILIDSFISFETGTYFPLILDSRGNSTILTKNKKVELDKIEMRVGTLMIDAPLDCVIDVYYTSMQDYTNLISKNSLTVFSNKSEFKGNEIYSSDNILWDVLSEIEMRDANVSIGKLSPNPDLKIKNGVGLMAKYTGLHVRNTLNYFNWKIEMEYLGASLPPKEVINQHINQTYNAFCAKNNICKDHLYDFSTSGGEINFESTCRQIDDDYCIGGYYADDPRIIDLHICYANNISLCLAEDFSYYCTVSNISELKKYVDRKTNHITFSFKSNADVSVEMGELPLSDFDLDVKGKDGSYVKFDIVMQTFNKLRNLQIKSMRCDFNVISFDDLIIPRLDSISLTNNAILSFNDRDHDFDMSQIKSFTIDQYSLKSFRAYNGTNAKCHIMARNVSITLIKNSVIIDGYVHPFSRIKAILFVFRQQTTFVNVSINSTFSEYITMNFVGDPTSELNINFLEGFNNIPSMNLFNISSIGLVMIRSSSIYLPMALTNCNKISLSSLATVVSLQSLTVDNFYTSIRFMKDIKNRSLTFEKLIVNGTSTVSCETSALSYAIVEELIMDKNSVASFYGLKFTALVNFRFDTKVSFSNCDISKMKILSKIENNSVADITLRDVDLYEMVPPENHFVIFGDLNFNPSSEFVIVDAFSNQLARIWADSVKIDPKVVKINGVKYNIKKEVSTALVKVVLSNSDDVKLSTVQISLIAGSAILVFLSVVVAVFLVVSYKKKRIAARKNIDSNLLFEIQ